MRTITTTLLVLFGINAFAQWELLREPKAAQSSSLEFFNNRTYFGTNGGGLYTSSDEGELWEWNTSVPEENVSEIFISKDSIIYLGILNERMMYSEDDGESWSTIINSASYSVSNLLIEDELHIYAGFSSCKYSTDGGVKFTEVKDSQQKSIRVNGINLFNDTIYIHTSNGILFSPNGLTLDFKELNFFSSKNIYHVNFHNGSYYVSTKEGIYKGETLDGENFTRIDIPKSTSPNAIYFKNSLIYLGTYSGLFYSINDGDTWTEIDRNQISNGNTLPFIIDIKEQGRSLVIATTESIWTSLDNGFTWKEKKEGLHNVDIRSSVVIDDMLFMGDSDGKIWKSTDGLVFEYFASAGGTVTALSVDSKNNLLIGDGRGIDVRNPVTGNLISSKNANNSNVDGPFYFVGSIANLSNDIYTHTDSTILKASTKDYIFNNAFKIGSEVNALFVTKNGAILVGSDRELKVYRTTAPQYNLTTGNGLPATTGNGYGTRINQFFEFNGKLYLSSTGGLYYSEDDGVNWTKDALTFSTWSNTYLPLNDVFYYDEYKNGIKLITSNGSSNNISEGLETESIRRLEIFNGYIYGGSSNTGIWRYKLEDLTAVTLTGVVLSNITTNSFDLQWDYYKSESIYEVSVSLDSIGANIDSYDYKTILGNSISVDNLPESDKYFVQVQTKNTGSGIVKSDVYLVQNGEYTIILNNGTKEIKEEELVIFPNPFTEYITVKSKTQSTFDIFSSDGHYITTQPTNEDVFLNQLPAGMYIIKNETAYYKLIKE